LTPRDDTKASSSYLRGVSLVNPDIYPDNLSTSDLATGV